MQAQFYHTTAIRGAQEPKQPEHVYTIVCCMCKAAVTENLVTVRLADGTRLGYCQKHAQGRGLS